MIKPSSIWIGYDPKEVPGYNVARYSLMKYKLTTIQFHTLLLQDLIDRGLYKRPISRDKEGRMWDDVSQAPMATEFSLTRFFLPHLTKGWALFCDCDILVRSSIANLFALADDRYAVMVVKHDHRPRSDRKMGNEIQTSYPRKNWSSVMLVNCDHPANEKLSLAYLNNARGLALHQFAWLTDDQIGELPVEWNWLVNHSSSVFEPHIVHFTDGYPLFEGHENDPYADEWRQTHREFLRV